MKPETIQSNWFVLHTRSRFENVVNDGLAKKSIEVFLPKILVRSKRRDRKSMIRIPVFPGYLFVKSDMNPYERVEIVKTIGVVRFIGTKDGPVPVPEETIESLKIMVNSEYPIITGNRLTRGDKVMVATGPFAGVIGTFVSYRGKGRIVINVEALGQTAAVDVDESDIEPLPKILA
jgi:transcription elongation factor/antiterminator RfaH